MGSDTAFMKVHVEHSHGDVKTRGTETWHRSPLHCHGCGYSDKLWQKHNELAHASFICTRCSCTFVTSFPPTPISSSKEQMILAQLHTGHSLADDYAKEAQVSE